MWGHIESFKTGSHWNCSLEYDILAQVCVSFFFFFLYSFLLFFFYSPSLFSFFFFDVNNNFARVEIANSIN